MTQGFNVSFEKLHKNHKKCAPDQIMLYQNALKLHKLLNEHNNVLSFEHITVMDQIVCTSKQIKFQILRHFHTKIGFYTSPVNSQAHIKMLFKFKLIKFQFKSEINKLSHLLVFERGTYLVASRHANH